MRYIRTMKYYFIIYIALIACISSTGVYAQSETINYANSLYIQAFNEMQRIFTVGGDYTNARIKLQTAQTIYQKNGITDQRLAKVVFRLAILYDAEANLTQALTHYLSANVLKKQNQMVYDKDFAYISVLTGNIYNRLGKLDSAEYYYKKGEIEVLSLQNQHIDLLYLYSSLGKFYYNTGDCSVSINYFEKSSQDAKNRSENRFIKTQNEQQAYLADALTQCGRYVEAVNLYKQLLPKHHKPDYVRLKLGEAYLEMNQPDMAIPVLQNALFSRDTTLQIRKDQKLAMAYAAHKEYKNAILHFTQSIALNKKYLKSKNIYLAQSYLGLGKSYDRLGQKKQTLDYYQQALQVLCPESLSEKGYPNPTHIDNVVSQLDLFDALAAKALAFSHVYQTKPTIEELKISLQTYQLAIRLAEQLRLGYDSDEAKLFFTQKIFPVYQNAVHTAFQLFQLTQQSRYAEQAFFLSEKSKAAILAESLQGLQITHSTHLPASLLAQERAIKQTINRLTVTLATLPGTEKAKQTHLQNQQRDARILWSELLKKFDANQKYYQLKYNTVPPTLAQLRKRILTPKTALIEYFWADTPPTGTSQKESVPTLLAFVITEDELQMIALPTSVAFRQALDAYHKSLFEHQFSLEQSQWAYTLYQYVFKPLQPLLKGCQHVIVVPDGDLCRIPMESLVSDSEKETYLLEDYIFRYAYSAMVLEFTTRHQTYGLVKGTLAMAPFAGKYGKTFRSTSLSPLPASKEEVEKIGGQIYLESAATKQVFLKMATRHGIIHLATHAKADSQSPLRSYISFYPQQSDSIAGYRLYTSELYNLELDSVQLVVLSACETGGGQMVRGEGVMSLARAFAYAGCPNIMMTLWKAEDWATAQITTRMHQYLQKGYDKDEALTFAKRDYLREAPPLRKNPYFWANFVLVGDSEPVYHPMAWPYWIVVILGILLLIGIFFYWKRKTLV